MMRGMTLLALLKQSHVYSVVSSKADAQQLYLTGETYTRKEGCSRCSLDEQEKH